MSIIHNEKTIELRKQLVFALLANPNHTPSVRYYASTDLKTTEPLEDSTICIANSLALYITNGQDLGLERNSNLKCTY